MTDDTNGTPPPPKFPPEGVTLEHIEHLINKLAAPANVVKNAEAILGDAMTRLTVLENQQKTFAAVWVDSIDTRKKQLDRIEEDLDGYSDKINAINDKLETAINFQVSNDEAIRLMKTRFERDLYGGTTRDGDTIIPGLMSTMKFMSDTITRQSEAIRLIEGRIKTEEELTARWKARNDMIASSAVKAIPLVIKFFAAGGMAGGLGTLIALVLKILGG